MNYEIEFTDVAEMEVQEIFLWLIGRSPEHAGRWQVGLESAVDSLRQFPTRCPLAPEHEAVGAEIRQLIYGAYRILFMLVDADNDGRLDAVRILHVRHGARRRLDDGSDAA